MSMSDVTARARLVAADHAVLCTVHARRGVDAVPVVFAVAEDRLVIPIDRVKPKAPGRLQRERNLAADPRATLLVEHWDPHDWARLWWVRAELRLLPDAPVPQATSLLAVKYAPYRTDASIARILVFDIVAVTGWAAAPADHDSPSTSGNAATGHSAAERPNL